MNVLFNNEKLRQLQLNLYELVGVQTNIWDITGKNVQLFGKHSHFCRIINDNPEGHRRCEECDSMAVKACAEKRQSYSYVCHAGLREIVLPVFDSGEIVAFIAFGQLLDNSPRKLQWENTLKSLDWYEGDIEELKEAYSELIQYTPAKFKAYEEILQAITSYIQLEGIIRSANFSDQQRLEMYIDEHYMEKLSLKAISDALGIGTTKLCALAKKLSADGSITKLISMRRVEAAKTLLLKEDLSIAEIAEKVGFSDYNYFTKIFKKIVGCTPTQYRKLKNSGISY